MAAEIPPVLSWYGMEGAGGTCRVESSILTGAYVLRSSVFGTGGVLAAVHAECLALEYCAPSWGETCSVRLGCSVSMLLSVQGLHR